MKITILGSGSAYGVPMAFNVWGAANPDNPKNRRSRASILIEDKGKAILVDAGPDFRYQINDNGVKNIDAVFITHGHYDHIGGIPELPRATKTLGHGITVFAAAETMAALKQSYGYLFRDKADEEPDSKNLTWQVLPDRGEFVAEGLSFETLLFQHHHIHSSAFRYQDFAYVTDWQALPENCWDFFDGLKLLVIECNNGDMPEDNGHSDIFKVQEVMARFKPERVVLGHLSRRIDAEAFAEKLPEGVELAFDGMVLTL